MEQEQREENNISTTSWPPRNSRFVFLQQKMNNMSEVNKEVTVFPADNSVCVCVFILAVAACGSKPTTQCLEQHTHIRENKCVKISERE